LAGVAGVFAAFGLVLAVLPPQSVALQ